jgi:hypothetical protein
MAFSVRAHHVRAGSANSVTSAVLSTAGADLIVLSVSWYGAATPVVSDSYGNTWTPLTVRSAGNNHVRLFYSASPPTGAGHTFTAAVAGGYPTLGVVAVTGALGNPWEQESGGGGQASSIRPGVITPSEAGDLFVTAVNLGSGRGAQIDGGFTCQAVDWVNAVNVGGGIAYFVQGPPAAVNPTWSWQPLSTAAVAMASFRSALSVTPQSLENAAPFAPGETIGYARATGGSSPYSWRIIYQNRIL